MFFFFRWIVFSPLVFFFWSLFFSRSFDFCAFYHKRFCVVFYFNCLFKWFLSLFCVCVPLLLSLLLLLLYCTHSIWLFCAGGARKIHVHIHSLSEHWVLSLIVNPNEITCGWLNEWELDSLGCVFVQCTVQNFVLQMHLHG